MAAKTRSERRAPTATGGDTRKAESACIAVPNARQRRALRQRASDIFGEWDKRVRKAQSRKHSIPSDVVMPIVFSLLSQVETAKRDWIKFEALVFAALARLGGAHLGYGMVIFKDVPPAVQIEKALELWWCMDRTLEDRYDIPFQISSICDPDYSPVLRRAENHLGTEQLADALTSGVRSWVLGTRRGRLPVWIERPYPNSS